MVLLFYIGAAQAKDPRIPRSLLTCADFTSHAEIGVLLEDYENTYPDIARAFSIGTSIEGRELWALLLSADPDQESVEPEIRIVGGIHGNECMSVDLVLEIIEALVDGYGDDEFTSDLLDGAEIVFVPLINPDGYTGTTARRVNANGVDLNRNFHFAWVREGTAPFSEPETRAMRDLSQKMSFDLGISYHTVATYVNSAWNYTPHHPPDEELFRVMGEAYAGTSGYKVTFGWDWYAIYGDVNDWSLGTAGAFDWTIELRKDRVMEAEIHASGLADFLSFVFVGARGVVSDRSTGEPLFARIHVAPEGAPVFTDPDVGDYHRILLPGTYSLTAVAPGYKQQTVQGVVVTDDGVTEVDFQLDSIDEPTTEYAFAVVGMTLPREIGAKFKTTEYLNDTMVWDALGPPDGWAYSLSPGGSITVDMGPNSVVHDVDGPDLQIVSGTGSDDSVRALVAANQDGPFVEVGIGERNLLLDIAPSGFDSIRYVRLEDLNDGPFNHEHAGYDLDAVASILGAPLPPDAGPDIDVDVDTDADVDSDADEDEDAGEDTGYSAGGCGCAVPGYPDGQSFLTTLHFALK